ncbi:Pectinesterase QRT1 [Sesamum alatum]|uniref:Pectinesterase n=1 Tax=Sesamum alatum TaxID=300844 RepID=A0AAE1XZ96_9LAMI|nr:Pectinesterase QRT1 [Sesamum alatum]
MNLSGFIVVIIVVLWRESEVGFGQFNDNYIRWDDLEVDDCGGETSSNRVIVVDKNGGGDSVTVQAAVDMVPDNNPHRVKIHIFPGVYREKVHIPKSKPYISFIGYQHRATETVVTWHDKASDSNGNGGQIRTWNSASVIVQSDYFCAAGITFQNTVVAPAGGQGYQAVALRIAGDKAMFYNVRFLGSQDTLLDESGTHYFYQCFIQGSTDFIFGNGRSLYEECTLSLVGNAYAIAAQSRNSTDDDTGFSFVNCTVGGTGPVYLGRAWGYYSRVIYSYTELDIDINPEGWRDMGDTSRHDNVVLGEYECRGKGADRRGRVRWSKGLSYNEAKPYLDTTFISGELWLRL